MHARPFDYHAAESVDHAIALLQETAAPKLLAGGHGLIPAMKKRELTPETVVDIGGLDELRGVEQRDGATRIGALTTHSEVLDSSLLAGAVPVVPATVAHITGGRQVHNFATIGGNIARAHPGYDYEGALLAAGCAVHVAGPDGHRTIPIAEFVTGACSTALRETELLTGIELPGVDGERVGGYAKRKEPASGNAIVGVATDVTVDGTIRSASVAVNGLQASAVELDAVADALTGRPVSEATVERAAAVAGDSVDPAAVLDNKKAAADYRLALLETKVRESLTSALFGES